MPALVLVPSSDTSNGLSLSLVALTMFKAGKLAPVNVGFTGFEINARKLRPLLVCLRLEPPHETNTTLRKMETKRALNVLFNPGTPRTLQDRELDAKSGL
jgi:hypothetical protein